MTYDGLWDRESSQQSWLEKATTEQRDWLEGLVALIVESDQEPVWQQVHSRFVEKFGEAATPEVTTLRKHVRYLVGKRG